MYSMQSRLLETFYVGPIGDDFLPGALQGLRPHASDGKELETLEVLFRRVTEDDTGEVSLEEVRKACRDVVRQMIVSDSAYAQICTQIPPVKAYLGGAYCGTDGLVAWTDRTRRLRKFNSSYWTLSVGCAATRWRDASDLAVKTWAEIGLPSGRGPKEEVAAGICVMVDEGHDLEDDEVRGFYEKIFVRREKPEVGVAELDKKNPFVYALSYKHQERHRTLHSEDFEHVLRALQWKHSMVAKGPIAIWIDVALEVDNREWLDRGLLPYLYFGVIAVVRSHAERNRLWLWLERNLMDRKSGAYEQDRMVLPRGFHGINGTSRMLSSGLRPPTIVMQGNAAGYGTVNPIDRLYKTGLDMLSSDRNLEVTYESDKIKLRAWFHNYFSNGAGVRGIPRQLEGLIDLRPDVSAFLRRLKAEADEYSSEPDENAKPTGNGNVCWLGPGEVAGSQFSELKLGRFGLVRKGTFGDRTGHFVMFVSDEGNDMVMHVRTTGDIDNGHAIDKFMLGGHLSNWISNIILAGIEFDQPYHSSIGKKDGGSTSLTFEGRTRSVDDIRWTRAC